MGKLARHLKTVRTHRKYVRKMCWKMGLFWQGLVHDLSKYSITELKIAKYYTGKKSPHQVCREEIGYSPSWNHHYHRNKHHFQFWWDEDEIGTIIPVKMPYKYVVESFCDMVGASKAYAQKAWEPKMVWDYWVNKCKGKRIMNAESEYLTERLIWNLYQYGEKDFLKAYKGMKKYLETAYNSGELIKEKDNIF
jgi:hypothetical protein